MLIKQHNVLEKGAEVSLVKRIGERDVSHRGAFPCGSELILEARIPRTLGVRGVVLRIARDGGEEKDLPFSFTDLCKGVDLYTLTLDTAALCGGEGRGLFYYELLFLRGFDTLFTDSVNNVDFLLSERSASRFRLLIHDATLDVPDWFSGGVMYHIFVDRFCKGAREGTLKAGDVLDPDWEHGIPQYPEKRGDALSNNVFFGGNLWGVIEKLDYLSSLGVTTLYLSPIFDAASNHRYDTGDYEHVDALLGGDEAFSSLAKAAHERGMRIILDGVFNHTGDDSRYFNRRGHYDALGAYQSPASPYFNWYNFKSFPEEYECWWGIEILPRLNHADEGCRHYFTAPDGIAARWLRAGADGWRLDVADELSDDFLDELHVSVRNATRGEGLIIGEVWENAADKISYGKRRRYLSGGQLDSVMNYPFRNAVLAFLQSGDAECFCDILTELYASYPTSVSHSLMNLLGTHDTERILTVLGDREMSGEWLSNAELSVKRLSLEERERGIALLKLASALQYTVFGVPSVYYGDEAGLEGYHDPFCRMPFLWGREDDGLLSHYRALGRLRRDHSSLRDGDFRFLFRSSHAFVFERKNASEVILVAANMGDEPLDYTLPSGGFVNALTGSPVGDKILLGCGEFLIMNK